VRGPSRSWVRPGAGRKHGNYAAAALLRFPIRAGYLIDLIRRLAVYGRKDRVLARKKIFWFHQEDGACSGARRGATNIRYGRRRRASDCRRIQRPVRRIAGGPPTNSLAQKLRKAIIETFSSARGAAPGLSGRPSSGSGNSLLARGPGGAIPQEDQPILLMDEGKTVQLDADTKGWWAKRPRKRLMQGTPTTSSLDFIAWPRCSKAEPPVVGDGPRP